MGRFSWLLCDERTVPHVKTDEWIEQYMEQHFPRPVEKLQALQRFIVETQAILPNITKPICLCKGELDDLVFQQSIDLIEANVTSTFKKKITYPNSGHLLTLDKEREQLYEDVQMFVEQVF